MYPFHLAIPVDDIEQARDFYRRVLGCTEGRSDTHWVDFNFYGHQLVCHLHTSASRQPAISNPVDGHDVPVPHFGVVLDMPTWETLSKRLLEIGVTFVIEPYIRFRGKPGEQATMFFYDPSGNAIEVKAFGNIEEQLFAV